MSWQSALRRPVFRDLIGQLCNDADVLIQGLSAIILFFFSLDSRAF